MSDLRDELYEENSSVNPNNGQISSQSKISSNKKINFNHEENGLNSGKKKIIRVKLKISNIKSSGETENATSMEMLNKKSYISEHCDDYECVEIKIPGRSQTTELVKSSKIYSELDFNENLSISDDIGIVENNIKTSSQFLKQDLRKNDYVISKDDDSTNKFEEEEYIEALLNREQRILEKLSASLRKGASRKDSLINDQECNNNSENTCEGDTNNETSTATLSKLSEKANRKQEEIWIDTSISNVGTPKGSGDEMAVKKEVNPLTSIEEYDNIKTSADEENKSTYPNNERKKSYDKNTITDHKWKNVYKNYLLLDNNNSGNIIDFQDKQEQENGQKMSYKTDGKSLPTTTKLLNGNNSTTNHQNVPCLPDEEKIKDSSIITDIVMKKYEEILRKFKQRSLQRKQNRKGPLVCENKEHIGLNQKLNRPTSLAIKNVPCTLSSSQLFNKTPDSGLDATQELYFSNFKSRESVQSSDQSLTYSPTIFLKEALGDEYMNTTYESEQVHFFIYIFYKL